MEYPTSCIAQSALGQDLRIQLIRCRFDTFVDKLAFGDQPLANPQEFQLMSMPFDTPLKARHSPTFSDMLFLGFLALVLLAVAAVGRMAYVEGQKNEVSKKMPWLERLGWSKPGLTASKMIMSSAAVQAAKQRRARPGPTACRSWSGSPARCQTCATLSHNKP